MTRVVAIAIAAAQTSGAEVTVPDNAHVIGNHWYCNDGFQKLGNACRKLSVPDDAHVIGNHWYCNDGFQKLGNACRKLSAAEAKRQKDFEKRVGENFVGRFGTSEDASDSAECRGYSGPGGACYSGPGGGLYSGPGGGLYSGPGGGLYSGPGGGLYSGPGGGMYSGPGGGLYTGPGGGLYSGPGGGIYTGPPSEDGYNGPWSPCITGVKGKAWMQENCPH